ncbi:MAG: aminotransferase class IV [Syntrophobacteraceae bacterium]|jgi:branched-subunit amino acid aminotransferase/4-amino-4-deoxychorismate lyase|nr:aminotransferase class IV [Syntrophobacteraceae bacterium]
MSAGFKGTGSVIWANGAFTTLEDCRISPLDRGFQYGDGLFETMRAEKGRILFLSRHVERLLRSMASLRLGTAGLPDWDSVLPEVLLRNGFGRETAVVKIMVTRGLSEGLGLPATDDPSVLITARPYRAPSETTYSEGWRLAVYRDGYSPPLAMHKSLNYLFYLTARQAAQDNGADEAVIVDASGFVAETAAGSLLIGADGRWWGPDSPYQLPGITVEAVCEEMGKTGRHVERKPTRPADLHRAETIYVLNSLMLVMPVRSVNGRALPRPDPALAAFLRERLLR